MSDRLPLTDQIRRAVDESGLTRYRICQLTGIDKGALSRFMSGKAGLSMRNLDRLAEVLGLSITVEGPAGRAGRQRKRS